MSPLSVPSLNQHIRALRQLAPAESPVVSWYIGRDGSPAGWPLPFDGPPGRWRGPGGVVFESAAEQAVGYLRDSLDEATRGVALFVRNGPHPFFLALQFSVPLPDVLVAGERPHLYPLFELRDSYDRFVAVAIRPSGVQLLELHLGGQVRHALWLPHDGTSAPARRYERTVRALEHRLSADGPPRFVLAGPEPLVDDFREALPPVMRHKLAAAVSVRRTVPLPLLVGASVTGFVSWEREESHRTVARLVSLLDSRRAVTGLAATASALCARRVDTLVLSKAFDAGGGPLCPACGYVGVLTRRRRRRCPVCASHLRADTRDALLCLAEAQGGEVELVDANFMLERSGGVGATLRYPVEDARLRRAS